MTLEQENILLDKLSQTPQGLGVEALLGNLSSTISKRTLQRRLDEWVKNGKIQRTGKARATRYLKPKRVIYTATPAEFEPDSFILREDVPQAQPTPSLNDGPALPSTARGLRDIVRQPQALRQPVGYQREFLEAYVPNKTPYLPDNQRAHLHEVGQSEHMAALPPGTYARQVLDRLIIDLSWNSSRLEGSTYSLLETDHLLALGATADEGRYIEAQMILNHKAAIEFLVESPAELGFNRYTFLNLHAILTEGLLKNARSEGALRQIPVGISGTVYHPSSQPAVIEECFDLILAKAGAIRDPLECCFFLMVHLPYLQPFEDGNKRMSRLAANLSLIQRNMAPLSFVGVPVRDYTDGIIAVYELNRVELLREVFAWAYEKSAGRYAAIRQEIGEPDPMHLRYRTEIKDLIRDVVVNRMDKPAAAQAVRRWAGRNVTASDRDKFIEIVEERLLALNEGSIARVRVRPSEFAAWWPFWKSQGRNAR